MLKTKTVIIQTDNPTAVSCTCVLCQLKEVAAKATAIKIDQELMEELNKRQMPRFNGWR